MYCGRVRCAECFPDAQPVKMVLELVDYDLARIEADFRELFADA